MNSVAAENSPKRGLPMGIDKLFSTPWQTTIHTETVGVETRGKDAAEWESLKRSSTCPNFATATRDCFKIQIIRVRPSMPPVSPISFRPCAAGAERGRGGGSGERRSSEFNFSCFLGERGPPRAKESIFAGQYLELYSYQPRGQSCPLDISKSRAGSNNRIFYATSTVNYRTAFCLYGGRSTLRSASDRGNRTSLHKAAGLSALINLTFDM